MQIQPQFMEEPNTEFFYVYFFDTTIFTSSTQVSIVFLHDLRFLLFSIFVHKTQRSRHDNFKSNPLPRDFMNFRWKKSSFDGPHVSVSHFGRKRYTRWCDHKRSGRKKDAENFKFKFFFKYMLSVYCVANFILDAFYDRPCLYYRWHLISHIGIIDLPRKVKSSKNFSVNLLW